MMYMNTFVDSTSQVIDFQYSMIITMLEYNKTDEYWKKKLINRSYDLHLHHQTHNRAKIPKNHLNNNFFSTFFIVPNIWKGRSNNISNGQEFRIFSVVSP